MPWFNVDDGFSNSKPVMRIPRRYRAVCVGVWTLTGAWSAKELTDGFIPAAVLEEYGATATVIQCLMDAELWEPADGGVQFRGWAKWQRTKQQVLNYRAAEAERKRNRRAQAGRDSYADQGMNESGKTRTTRNSKTQATDQQQQKMSAKCPTGTPHGLRAESPPESDIPIPKPLPNQVSTSLTLVEGGAGGDPAVAADAADTRRGHRLPANWRPSPDTIAAMRQQFPHVDLKAIHEEFTDYWRGVPGAKGRKLDWEGTWRNRVREIAGRQRAPNGHTVIGKPTQKALGWQAAGEALLAEMENQ